MNTRIRLVAFAALTLVSRLSSQTPPGIGGNVDILTGGDLEVWEGSVPPTRLHVRDLGLAPFDVIPAGQTAITSLVAHPDGKIYGGTTGEVANLFVFSPGHNIVFPLGTIPGQQSVYHSLVCGPDGAVYAGTTLNPQRVYGPDESLAKGTDWIYESVRVQIRRDFAAYEGGHLYRYDPATTKITFLQKDFRIGKPCPLTDLGIPVAHEGIYTLLIDASGQAIYGITYPGGVLFRHDIATRRSTIVGPLNRMTPKEEYLPVISRALVQDRQGFVYASTDRAHLIRYEPATGRLNVLEAQLPGLAGRELYNGLQAAVLHPDGHIYGGTTDGYLFCFNPETGEMRNLGKPLIEPGIAALAVGRDGRVYGVGGRIGGVDRMFVYQPKENSLCDLGMLEVAVLPYYEWKGFHFESLVAGRDGSIYVGNAEHRSRLFIYNP